MIKRAIAAIVLTAVLATAAGAQTPPPPPPPTGPPLKFDKLVAEVDTDHDGKLSKAEWDAAALPGLAFGTLDTDKDNALTLAELTGTAPPPGIDTDHDGSVSPQELRDFAKKMETAPPPKP